MKRPLQLSLAIALALGVTDAFALGLGAIQVRSGLNQPLNAEIPVIVASPGEAEGLLVQLATAEDFERVGMNRSSIGIPLEFSIGKNARGESVIRVTSTEIVREPFLGILVEANWPKGRLLREYTMLLDPPVMAPAVKGSSAVAVAAREPERATTQPIPESRPAPTPAPAAAPAAPRPATAAAPPPRPAPAAAPPAAPRQISGSEYGPVAAGETLGEIARATRQDENVSVNQMMLALLKNNPDAFFRDNINALKRGAVLRIPSAEEISATGSARDAAVAVRSQIDEWRGGAGSAPTLVAETGASTPETASTRRSTATTTAAGERLALVPPREGQAGEQTADRPTTGTPGGTGDVASRAELARVREALTSREQEAGELKSRVKDLEDLRTKNTQLISLQNTELAELREKLKAMQDATPVAPVTTTPSVATTTTTTTPAAPEASAAPATASNAPVVTKDDIWGDAGTSTVAPEPAATPPGSASDAANVQAEADALAGTSPSPVADATTITDPVAGPLDPTLAAPPVVDPALAPETSAPTASMDVEPAVDPQPVVAPMPTVEPLVTTPATPESPWYMQPWALAAAGLGGLLLVLLGVAGMRRRKTGELANERGSIAESFGDAPLAESYGGSSLIDPEEDQLIDQVRADPGNAGAHLELLSLYYAQRDGGKFEAAAEEMYAYIADPNQAEWREARSMGEDLVPHNPLFGGTSNLSDMASDDVGIDNDNAYRFDEDDLAATGNDAPRYDFDEPAAVPPPASPYATTTMPAVDFDFDADKPRSPPASDSAFSFDLPPIEPVEEPPMVTEYDIEPDAPVSTIEDDEFFAGDDAIGTKLDLAKAYLDMGDPDGARAMLEEVLAEGSAAQQDEARKLIAEIR